MLNPTSGIIYISKDGEEFEELGTVSSFDLGYSDCCCDDEPVLSISKFKESFEFTCHVAKEFMLAITGMKDVILKCCHNSRVVHLALHGKKKRTRKKNINRAIKILERIAKKEVTNG